MMDREQYILEFSVLTFIGMLILICLTVWIARMVRRHRDNKPILDAIEGVRQQQSAEHSAFQHEQRTQGTALSRLIDRFGFLKRIK